MVGNIDIDFKEWGGKAWTEYITLGTVERTVFGGSSNKFSVS
jgi:hypothetical protein